MNKLNNINSHCRTSGNSSIIHYSLFTIHFFAFLLYSQAQACTIGIANGTATSDGRPLLWKTRDSIAKNNEVVYSTSGKYKYIALTSAGSDGPWMGVNEKGFAIINSNSGDMKRYYPKSDSGPNHPAMMKLALESCISVADFQKLLDQTNVTGRKTATNFACIDAAGQAALFETANKQYFKLDTFDKSVAQNGYIVHSNFALNGDTKKKGLEKSFSYERYKRASDLTKVFYDSGRIDFKEILQKNFRDFADFHAKPFDLPIASKQDPNAPFGYFNTQPCICRYYTVSAAVFVGVLPNEDPRLSTMWTILAMPASGIATPYWPVGDTPFQANGPKTSPLCDISREINNRLLLDTEKFENLKDAHRYFNSYLLADAKGNGLLSMIIPAEDKIIDQAQTQLVKWRSQSSIAKSPNSKTDHKTLNTKEMLALESKLAAQAIKDLRSINDKLKSFTPAQ